MKGLLIVLSECEVVFEGCKAVWPVVFVYGIGRELSRGMEGGW